MQCKDQLYDPLAEFLGATNDGILQYGYFDAVRLAGHSCPTVAAAYWSTCKALAYLYPDAMPVRGEIRVEFSQEIASGVTGVIANVVSMLTGAMSDNGSRASAAASTDESDCFLRWKCRGNVFHPARYRSGRASSDKPETCPCFTETARADGKMYIQYRNSSGNSRIPAAWQARVRSILLEHGNDPDVFLITPV